MARKPKGEPEDDEESLEELSEEENLDEAGFHLDEDAEGGAKKSLDSEADVEYVKGPKKPRRRPGTKLLDDFEDHLEEEEEDEKDQEGEGDEREEDDLDDEEDWEDDDEEDAEDDDED